ncbi:MAG: MFS transporter [Anaerolineae bacterium]|nr:MFS transporter [Anaerolineae bacterium]
MAKLRIRLHLMRRRTRRFTAGGRWTEQLRPAVRQNLRWFWFDGVFANASEAVILAYLSLFVLALGASPAQIGLMSALSSLSAALFLLPGAAAVERWGHRKQTVVFSSGVVGRAMLLLLALLPLAFNGPTAVVIAIGLVVVRNAANHLAFPAWMSLTADIVPLAWRGRYFGSRNIMMSLAGMTTTFLVGLLITFVGGLKGYQLALAVAFVIGAGATYSFNRIRDPLAAATSPQSGLNILGLFGRWRQDAGFWILCATTALWNFSLNIAGPFFNVYLVDGLQAKASMVGALSVVSSLAALPSQRLFGALADRWGPRRVQLLTGLLIPILPWGWALVRSLWQLVPVEFLAGFLWAGYNLAAFNFLLTLMPEGQRERYSALYQIIVMTALAGGAALGGVIAEYGGYKATFIFSGLGRLTAALLFVRFVPQMVSEKS